MKKFSGVACATVLTACLAAPAYTQSVATSDPFVSSQGANTGFLTIGGVGAVLVTTTIVAIVIAISDSSSSSTTS